MYKVRYKSQNASQAWSTLGSYGNEQSALSNASRVSGKYFMVQVIDPRETLKNSQLMRKLGHSSRGVGF